MRFQSLRIEISFIFKSNHITKAEICYIYGYGCVLLSFDYKVKAKKAKGNFVIQLILAIREKNLEFV